jgi:hypothetical protein
VDQSADFVLSLDRSGEEERLDFASLHRGRRSHPRCGRSLFVVLDVLLEHAGERSFVEDQEPVEIFGDLLS